MVIDGVASELDGVEGYDLLEEIECGITGVGVREGSDTRSTGPGDDRGQEYTDKDCALDVVHYEKDCQDTGPETQHASSIGTP